MSYKIRYGFDRHRAVSPKQTRLLRCAFSAALMLIAGVCRILGMWPEPIRQMLCGTPLTTAERAVAELSCALARDEGWYRARGVWCRTILNGTAA